MRRWVVVAVACTVLVACGMSRKMQQLEPGMTEAQVVDIMGDPDGMTVEGSAKALLWSNRLMSGDSWDRADYWAILEGDRVTSFGPGEVRRGAQPNTLILIPVR